MTEPFVQTSFLWGLFLVVYLTLLRNETYFKSNRTFLIVTLLLSLVLPNFNFAPVIVESSNSYLHQSSKSIEAFQNEVITALPNLDNPQKIRAQEINPISYLNLAYLVICLIMISRLLYGYRNLKSIRYNVVQVLSNKVRILSHTLPMTPFSFGSDIYINEQLIGSSEYASIIKHEYEHIHQRHWVDLAICSALKTILWWHPFVYLYEKLIRENHEFLADEKASTEESTSNYILLLSGLTSQPYVSPFVHNFITPSLKKRIDMLLKQRTTMIGKLKYLAIVPALTLLTFIFSCQTKINYDSYEVGAAVDKIININYFKIASSVTLESSYNKLKEKYPEHLPYIQKRLIAHFETIGGSLSFNNEDGINFDFANGLDEIADQVIRTYPSLVPLRTSDIQVSHLEHEGTSLTSLREECKGIDYVAEIGAPVYASGDGLVLEITNSNKGYGNTILLRHGSDVQSYYGHLSEIFVSKGEFVEKGSIIGKVGDSGMAKTPHLHFEVHTEGNFWPQKISMQAVD